MGPTLRDRPGERCGLGPGLTRPPDEALRDPLKVNAVCRGHIARIGRASAFPVVADVGCDTPVPVEDLDGGRAEPDLDLSPDMRLSDQMAAITVLGFASRGTELLQSPLCQHR